MNRQRTYVLAGLLVIAALLTATMLSNVLSTVFFAVTVAYVMFPLSTWLVTHGLSKRVAAAITTIIAFLAGTAVAVPLAAVLYLRRRDLFVFLRQLPETVTVAFGELSYVIEIQPMLVAARQTLTGLAVSIASETPVLALKIVLFSILVYAMLWRPNAPGKEIYRTIPAQYHDVIDRLHSRLRSTLYAIYVLQAATAFGTFLMAWAVFSLLGYNGAFALAVVAGILQFVPVVGPSVVVVAIAIADLVAGDTTGAILITVFGLVLVGFLPDAVIRPRLAQYTTGMPASLYFVGFTGGVLSLGLIGFIAGPVIIAMLVEIIHLVADEQTGEEPTAPQNGG